MFCLFVVLFFVWFVVVVLFLFVWVFFVGFGGLSLLSYIAITYKVILL